MKRFDIATVATAAALFSQQAVAASPIAVAHDLVARGGSSADAFGAIVGIINQILGMTLPSRKAYDIKENPDFCIVRMETTDGANCKASVECDSGTREYNPNGEAWNACYLNGVQYFHDDRIGDFSISFVMQDGDGQGLTNPVLRVAYLSNWTPFDVYALAQYSHWHYDDKPSQRDAFICAYGNWEWTKGRTRSYLCGVPKIGRGGFGYDSVGPTNSRGYAEGWCVAHIIQYQKPDPAVDAYGLESTGIFDNNRANIGSAPRAATHISVGSKLPWTLEVSTGNIDSDPVYFAYGDQAWDSNDSKRCSVGNYDSGSRQMDCGFSCYG